MNLKKFKVDISSNTIYIIPNETGTFNVTVRNDDGSLVFEQFGWRLESGIEYYLSSEKKLVNPEMHFSEYIPYIESRIDYESNRIHIYIQSHSNFDISIYDVVNNKEIHRQKYDFTNSEVWYSPVSKLTSFGKIQLIIRDEYKKIVYSRFYKNDQYIFCHIPKTAGTSIKKALNTRVNHEVYQKQQEDAFSFAFVRNPYDRFLSTFFFLKNGGLSAQDKKDSEFYIGDSDIHDFIKNKLSNSLTQMHFKPQHEYIPNGVDFVGKVENIQSDFNSVCEIIGIDPIDLPHENKCSYDYQLSEEQKVIVYNIYRQDFLRFGYDA